MRRRYPLYVVTLLLLGLILLAGGGNFHQPTLLDRIQAQGELVVVTQVSATTMSRATMETAGLEHDLARAFAETLGVDMRMIQARNMTEVYRALAGGHAHIAASRISVPERARRSIRFTAPYLQVKSKLIYRFGNTRPQDMDMLTGSDGLLAVPAHSGHADQLKRLSEVHEGLRWEERQQSVDDLLYQVWNGELDFTVADAHELTLSRQYHPELRAAFTLGDPRDLVWALPDHEDTSLFDAVQAFLAKVRKDGMLDHLYERYYGHLGDFDYVGVRLFLRHVTGRLPEFRPIFQEAAKANGLDWRLLAAIGYQESLWDPSAVSHTGVRGLMMLTQPTASDLGVDRLDPAESIHGGARYFRSLWDRLPAHIDDPTRSWLALAAYNVGMGHLEDARMLTEKNGGDPDVWRDIKEHLPLLSDPEWYPKTRYGQARGWEPVVYVSQVRAYYDLLVRITDLPGEDWHNPETAPARAYRELDGLHLRLDASIESAL